MKALSPFLAHERKLLVACAGVAIVLDATAAVVFNDDERAPLPCEG